MDFLDQARNLLNTLKKRSEDLEEIKIQLKNAPVESLEKLFAEEFEIAVELSDIYYTLNLILNKMLLNEDTIFIAKRLKNQADLIMYEHEEYDLG